MAFIQTPQFKPFVASEAKPGWEPKAGFKKLVRMMVDCDMELAKGAYDPVMLNGTPRKLLDVARLLALGWAPKIRLRSGIEQTYNWYRNHYEIHNSR